MKKTTWLFLMMVLCGSTSGAQEAVRSTAEDQKSVAVTVYNSDIGLVKDTRHVNVPTGSGELRFADVAAQIQPVTVGVRSLGDPKSFRVLEQNYEYDLMSPEKVLDKYVGRKLKIMTWNDFQDRKDTVEATLLSNEGQIYQVGDEIYLGYPGVKVVPELPDNLISKPTLTWLYENQSASGQDLEVSYLTAGISWKADYVMTLDAADKNADLSGWVTVDNRSGAMYRDATLKLVAGDIHREQQAMDSMAPKAMMMRSAAVGGFAEQPFFEYHIYNLDRKTTIKNNQTKQINLLEASGLAIQKEYSVRGESYVYYQAAPGQSRKLPVGVFVKFINSKTNKLGMPLPAGTFRLYKKDGDGSQQFIGEFSIRHTPADEGVELKAGDAFDVTAERVQTDFKQLTSRSTESEWEITLKNHKTEDITVAIVESLTGDWKIVSSSHPYKKTDAFAARFDIPVPKNGEVKVKYRAYVQY